MGKKEKKLKELEKESQEPDFWQDREKAIKISQEINQLQKEISEFEELEVDLELLKEAGKEPACNVVATAGRAEIAEFEKKLKKKEVAIFLSGKYDKGNAVLSIFAGAGGQDAQDWATILLRMYERYCVSKGFPVKILHQSFGEGGGPEGRIGTKSATLEIKGNFAFGFLKRENGVHRLVRISPFSPKALRHTSFALVEVLPEISKAEETEIKIRQEDLKTETFRSSGPGGQYVNKRESAVRITHIPTKIQVSCQVERSLGQNKEKAMKILLAKLYQLKEEEKLKELKEIKAAQWQSSSQGRGERISASWGNQIRSYVLHPYKLVKDLRTGLEITDAEGVLDGNLDEFVEAEIKTTNRN